MTPSDVLSGAAPWAVQLGDCRTLLAQLPDHCLDACVTDPPYELNFMSREWDRRGVAFDPATWREVRRVMKPGAHLLAFGGARTSHRLVTAIEDAGLAIRDSIHWLYGEAMPKSLDVSKALDKVGGPAQQWSGWATYIKPGHEPLCLARKPLEGTVVENVTKWGVGALNIDGCRVATGESLDGGAYSDGKQDDQQWGTLHRRVPDRDYQQPSGRYPPNVVLTHSAECRRVGTQRVPATSSHGERTAVRRSGVHAAAGGHQRVGREQPVRGYADADGLETLAAYDCAPGCPVAALDAQSGERPSGVAVTRHGGGRRIFNSPPRDPGPVPDSGYFDTGTAARFYPQFAWSESDWWPFYYCAKASRGEREKGCDSVAPNPETGRHNDHVAVKPVKLCRWLCRLVTPPGGIVLDPFAGTASIGVACKAEGFRYLGMEEDARSHQLALARLSHTDSPMADRFEELCR